MNNILLEFAGRMADRGATQLPESFGQIATDAKLFLGGRADKVGAATDFRLNARKGRVSLIRADRSEVAADVQIAGTLSNDGSWMWAWGHPDVEEHLQAAAWAVRQFGERQEIEELMTRGGATAPDRVDAYLAICAYISNANGVFMGDHGAGGKVALVYYLDKQLDGLLGE
ncbi:MAG: DUF6882 domain-containing protein [Pseudomonadota bacterium]